MDLREITRTVRPMVARVLTVLAAATLLWFGWQSAADLHHRPDYNLSGRVVTADSPGPPKAAP